MDYCSELVPWCGPALGPGWDTVKHSDDQITPRNHISLGLALGAASGRDREGGRRWSCTI